MQRRILWVFTLSMAMLAALLGRLFVLSVMPDHTGQVNPCSTPKYAPVPPGQSSEHTGAQLHSTVPPLRWQSKARTRADLEHFRVLQTDDARGRILFRNGSPWSGAKQRIAVATGVPDGGQGVLGPGSVVTPHSGRTKPALETFIHREDVPSPDPVIGQVGKPDVWPGSRVVPEQGRSGLEFTFDRFLQGRRPGYFARLTDVFGKQAAGSVYSVQATSGTDVRTTIDSAWQWNTEHALRSAGVGKGAVVILSIPSNQVLALASRNTRDPSEIVGVKAAIPGSVFKIVTAAAALDSFTYTSRSRFLCTGHTHIPGVSMHCWRVHGKEDLREAFASSCDVAFAEVGVRLKKQAFVVEENKLRLSETGLQSIDGRPVLAEGETGKVFHGSLQDNGYLANTAIGQQDVRISPLQAALLSATVANGGVYRSAQLIRDLEVRNVGVRYFSEQPASRAMSALTASRLASYMRLAVTSPKGTAHSLLASKVAASVKTGTAEVGQHQVNAWITGFAPSDHPRIAFSIYVGDETEKRAHQQVFTIANSLLSDYHRFFPEG